MPINMRIFCTAGFREDLQQNAISIQAIGIFLEQIRANFRCFYFLPRIEIGFRQQDLHIYPIRVFREHPLNFPNGLRIQLTLHIHIRQRATRHAHLGRRNPIPASIKPLQFTLHSRVRRLRFESPLHVPDSRIHAFVFITDQTHANMRHKIIRHRHQYPQENICRIVIALGFQIRFSQQTICFKVFGESFENMMAMGDRFFNSPLIDHTLNFSIVNS